MSNPVPRRRRRTRQVHPDKYNVSKKTNLALFIPAFNEIEKVYKMHAGKVESNVKAPIIISKKVLKSFTLPVTRKDVRKAISDAPERFTKGLKAVFLLSGSKKQKKAFNLFRFGSYWKNCIFLHAYPKCFLDMYFEKSLKQSFINEYKNAGAKVIKEDKGITISFNKNSLKQYYLKHVLFHELGHHVLGTKHKHKNEENFAEWFAAAFG